MKDSLTKDDLRKIMAVGGRKCASFRCHQNAVSGKYCDSHEQGQIARQKEIDAIRFSLGDTKDCPKTW